MAATQAIDVVEAQLRTGNPDDLDRRVLESLLTRFRMMRRVAGENIAADLKVVATGYSLDIATLGIGRLFGIAVRWGQGKLAVRAAQAARAGRVAREAARAGADDVAARLAAEEAALTARGGNAVFLCGFRDE